jgi:hypothetical protein
LNKARKSAPRPAPKKMAMIDTEAVDITDYFIALIA